MFGKRKLPESLYRQQVNAGYRPDQPYTVDGFEFLPMAQKQAKLAEIRNGAQQFASENFSRGMAQDPNYPAQADYMPQGYMGASGDGSIEHQMDERNIPVSGSMGGSMGGAMIDPRMVEQPKPRKRGLFGSGAGIADILGIIGDGFGDRGPIYAQGKMHQAELDAQRQRIAEAQRQKLEDRAYEASEWTRRQQWDRENPKPAQATEFERLLQASGLPIEQQTELMRQYVQNRANPVQGVPYTDAEGNTGLQFIRPGQQAQGTPVFAGWPDEQGDSAGNGTDGFR